MVAAPAATSTYSDQLDKTAPGPPPRWELSSPITAAMNPHEIPVTAPSTAARRDPAAPGRLPRPRPTTRTAATTAAVTSPDTSQDEPGACSRPAEGEATRRNTPMPADMAAAASQSRHRTRPEPWRWPGSRTRTPARPPR